MILYLNLTLSSDVAYSGVHEPSLTRLDPAQPGSWAGLDGSSNFFWRAGPSRIEVFYWRAEPSPAEPNAFGEKRFHHVVTKKFWRAEPSRVTIFS
jgi:hypothetical protein